MLLDIAVVLALILVNGVLAMAELAVVSSRRTRLQVLADQGVAGAGIALRLAAEPGRFLSTVQIGITLVGILAGAYSGVTLGARLSASLAAVGVPYGAAETLGIGSVVVVITYLSLIVGELVPKRLALRHPERIAARLAPTMALLARLTGPAGWLLDRSGNFVLGLLGQAEEPSSEVSDQEIRSLIAEAERAGVVKSDERTMIAGVMRLADRSARELMTPRLDLEVLDLALTPDELRRQVSTTGQRRLPVRDGGPDDVIGVVAVNMLLADGGTIDARAVRARMEHAPIVLDTAGALQVVGRLRASTTHLALVFDEFGNFEGVITALDVLEAITGSFQDAADEEPAIVTRADGSLLVAGWMPADELAEHLGLTLEEDRNYATAAGFVLSRFGRLPGVGEHVDVDAWRFEIVDLDGKRIDKLLAARLSSAPGSA